VVYLRKSEALHYFYQLFPPAIVDDASEREFLKRPLEEAVAALPLPTFVLRHHTMSMTGDNGFFFAKFFNDMLQLKLAP
jgi:hypothetical protein